MSTSIQAVGGANPLTYDMVAIQQMRQERTPQQASAVTMAPVVEQPRTAAQPVNVSTDHDSASQQQQMSQQHLASQQLMPAKQNKQSGASNFDVSAFTQSIEVQRAASRLMAKANELEQLAQELRSQSRTQQQNQDSTQQVKAQLAISDASKATSVSNNVDT